MHITTPEIKAAAKSMLNRCISATQLESFEQSSDNSKGTILQMRVVANAYLELLEQLEVTRLEHHITAEHIAHAREWDDGWDVLLWATEHGANIAEMKAWRRACRGDDLRN